MLMPRVFALVYILATVWSFAPIWDGEHKNPVRVVVLFIATVTLIVCEISRDPRR